MAEEEWKKDEGMRNMKGGRRETRRERVGEI
jgi:hypothetical protein